MDAEGVDDKFAAMVTGTFSVESSDLTGSSEREGNMGNRGTIVEKIEIRNSQSVYYRLVGIFKWGREK